MENRAVQQQKKLKIRPGNGKQETEDHIKMGMKSVAMVNRLIFLIKFQNPVHSLQWRHSPALAPIPGQRSGQGRGHGDQWDRARGLLVEVTRKTRTATPDRVGWFGCWEVRIVEQQHDEGARGMQLGGLVFCCWGTW